MEIASLELGTDLIVLELGKSNARGVERLRQYSRLHVYGGPKALSRSTKIIKCKNSALHNFYIPIIFPPRNLQGMHAFTFSMFISHFAVNQSTHVILI